MAPIVVCFWNATRSREFISRLAKERRRGRCAASRSDTSFQVPGSPGRADVHQMAAMLAVDRIRVV